jgi:hypothetical protein
VERQVVLADQDYAAARFPVGVELLDECVAGIGAVDAAAGHDDDAGAHAAQRSDDLEFPLRGAVRDRHGHDESGGLGCLRHTCRDGGEVRVVDTVDDQRGDVRRTPRDRLGGQMRCVVQFRGRGEHTVDVLLPDVADAAVEHPRRRRL